MKTVTLDDEELAMCAVAIGRSAVEATFRFDEDGERLAPTAQQQARREQWMAVADKFLSELET